MPPAHRAPSLASDEDTWPATDEDRRSGCAREKAHGRSKPRRAGALRLTPHGAAAGRSWGDLPGGLCSEPDGRVGRVMAILRPQTSSAPAFVRCVRCGAMESAGPYRFVANAHKGVHSRGGTRTDSRGHGFQPGSLGEATASRPSAGRSAREARRRARNNENCKDTARAGQRIGRRVWIGGTERPVTVQPHVAPPWLAPRPMVGGPLG